MELLLAITFIAMFFMKNYEDIVVELDIADSALTVSEVIPILEGFQGMTYSLNTTLNKVYSCGYEDVSLEVVGFEHGCLRIPLRIKKQFSTIVTSIGKDVIAGLMVWYLTSKLESCKVQTPLEPVTIERSEINKNRSLRDSVNKIANTVVNSGKISNLSLKYTDGNNQEVSVTIDKTQMASAITNIDDSTSSYDIHRATIQIVAPTLEAKSVQWKVRYDGRVRAMKMNDMTFLTLIDKRNISFSKGDVLTCDIQVIETLEMDGSTKVRYVISKVYGLPHYHRVPEEQKLNFE